MKIIHCLPIDQNTRVETLSYFSQKEIPVNSVITVPLRNRLIQAVAVSSDEISDMKSVIKKNPYKLKKVSGISAPSFFTEQFIKAVEKTAEFFAAPTGAILSSVTPAKIIAVEKPSLIKTGAGKYEKTILQTADAERFIQYKNIIRQSFSNNLSVTALVPTVTDGEKLKTGAGKGVEKYCYFFHSGLGKKQLASDFKKMSLEKHPVFFIGTGGSLNMMPENSSLIIVERESSPAYKIKSRPYTDFRIFADNLAESMKIQIIFGDDLLTLENYYRFKIGLLGTISAPKLRSQTEAKERVIDMRNYKPAMTGKYIALSDELINCLNEAKSLNDLSFVYTSRKGLYPNTVCGDCGSVLSCGKCGAALVLHNDQKTGGKIYICHRCGEKRDPHTRCNECDSWKLITLGAGSEKIEEELKKFIPKAKIFKLDRDTAKNRENADKIARAFYESPGSILVGTELAIPYIGSGVALGAIASLDSLFCLPEYRINEKIMGVITRVRSASSKKFIIQTRRADSTLIQYGAKGNLADFYEEELALRKKYDYPPFSTFIKITARGNEQKISEDMENLKSNLAPQDIHIFPALNPKKRNLLTMHGLLKMAKGSWPSSKISRILKNLPPYFTVNVEPDSLL